MRSETDIDQRLNRPDCRRARRQGSPVGAVIVAALGAVVLGACSSGPAGIVNGGKIDVKYYHLNPLQKIETVDQMIIFERLHHLHGAIDATELETRYGNYFTILWRVDDQRGPVTVRFEYRHATTGTVTDGMETEVVDVRKRNRTVFEVTGQPYLEKGKVIAFKVSLIRDGEVLATSESFMWED